MDHSGDRLTLYAAQAAPVLAALARDGVCHSRAEYVQKKYGESAPVFLTAYHWFVQQLPRFVPKPEGAEFPYWAFRELYSLDQAGTAGVLKLQVPKEQAVLFAVEDWTKITQLRYIGKDAADEQAFAKDLAARGLSWNQVMLTAFYPDLKQQIYDSWQRLFRYHEALLRGEDCGGIRVQAGLWELRREWVQEK
jgi:hypothetical protein